MVLHEKSVGTENHFDHPGRRSNLESLRSTFYYTSIMDNYGQSAVQKVRGIHFVEQYWPGWESTLDCC